MTVRLILFGALSTAIMGGGVWYIGARLSAAVPPRLRGAVWAGVLLAALLVPPGMALGRADGLGPWADVASLVAYLSFGALSLLLAGLVSIDAIRFVGRGGLALLDRHGVDAAFDPGRRETLLTVARVGLVGLTGFVMAVGYREARRLARTVAVDIPIEGLPPALHGLRIVQLSDIHVGPTIRRSYLQAIVDRVNELTPDLVAITGDLIDGSVAVRGPDVAPLADLKARHGTFFCTGNHEYYSGVHEWLAELERLGVKPLVNAHTVLEHDGARFLVAGVTDYSAARMEPSHATDPEQAIAGAPEGLGARVLLAHQPRSAYAAAALDFFDLQLSGHTHGGQYAPWTALVQLVQPFAVGLHRLRRMWIYTSRGTGYWGPPVRLAAPSEITVLRLVKA
ncbi:MAG: metallophosphoesterase [Myxococcota bacterium]|nr:metallophosphoesterase [Myxococcota bacterium]